MESSSKRIYLDLEYLYPGMTPEKGRPSEKEKRQIVQIGAILFDGDTGLECESFDVLVLPAFEKKLPPFFVELTRINQRMVDAKAISFPEALKHLVSFCKGYPIWIFHADQSVLEQNCQYFDIPFPFQKSFIQVKEQLPTWGLNPDQYSSGTLFKAAGLQMDGSKVHNALHDVRSMANAVWVFEHPETAASRSWLAPK
ncbi:MAG: 3'-5' exonuclease [Patescibacteria group bacterium]